MMKPWQKCLLGDVITLKRGYDLPSRERQNGDVPVVSSSGITGFHDETKAKAPGVVTGRYGTLGEVFYLESDFFPLNTTLYVCDFKGNNARFVSYLLKTLNLGHKNVAAAVPGLNRNDLHLLPVRKPDLKSQKQIADILSTYDRLIENNARRIKILEEMAQLLYREWFVNFRFPGHEDVKLVESAIGLIPEGWEVSKLSDICSIVMGQSPKSEFYNETGEGLPFHQGVSNFGSRFPTDKTYSTVSNRVANAQDILFSVRAPVGRINIATHKIALGRGLCAIRSDENCQSFIFQQLKDRFQEEDCMGSGTIYKAVTKDDMHSILMICPPINLTDSFELFLKPIFRNLEILIAKNDNLRQTRDRLLPKLISGEIDVEALDLGSLELGESIAA